MKRIECADLVPGCTFTAEAETEKELLERVAVHAKQVHGLDTTPDLVEKAKSKIKEK